MRTLAGKISVILLAEAALALAQDTSRQPAVAQPPVAASEPAPSPANRPEVEAASPSPERSPAGTDTSAALDYLFNRKPQDGTAGQHALDAGKRAETKEIAEDAVGNPRQDDPQARARYKRYLDTAEVPKEILTEYFAKIQSLSYLVQSNQLFEAWEQLHQLAEYQAVDAGISRDLANRVESIWNMDKASADLARRNEKLRKDVGSANSNADLISDQVMEKQIEYQRKLNRGESKQQKWKQDQNPQNPAAPPIPARLGGDNSGPPTIAGLEGKLQMTEEYLKSLELKAKIKLNELKQQKLLEQAKADFSDYISALFKSGRLNHVILAADFYRKIFQEGEYPTEMARQVNASLEINRDVASAVEVVRYKVERGQLTGANESLTQAFVSSELNREVLGLERPLKEKVADFNAKLDQMRNLIEARDFGNLEILIAQIKVSASDFDTTKPMAIVNAVKLESKMRLGKAKLAAQQGDLKLAMEEFRAAAEAWPGNPDLEDKALTFFETQDLKSQSLVEFDRLYEAGDYRAIFDKQLAFAPAIKGDSGREEALKKALEAVKNAELASEKANVMMMNGDVFGAWETIELAAGNLPEDKKLNKLRADLAGRGAEFVSAINKARNAEGKEEVGYSLTWYVNAQRQYPASLIANDGIERLSKKLFQKEM